jgi:23S rRNA G2445 N2-methylase RlmL
MEELCRKVSKMPIWKQYISLPIDRWSPNTNNLVKSKSRKNVMGDIINDSMLPLLDIRVVSTKSRLYHTKGISERVERGIWNALGLNGQAIIDAKNANEEMLYHEKKIIPILVRIHKDEVQISIDTSLTPLHNRGYRLETSKAPLREDIAYAMLFAAGWAQSKNMLGNHICGNVPPMRYLLDPFCGSGTIIIEGALMSLGIPPGFLRSSPFSSSSFFADCEKTWKDLVSTSVDNSLEQAEKNLFKDKLPKLLGSDRDMGAIEAAISNANRAGVSKFVQFHHSAISANPWIEQKESINEKLLVATNPPFGVRVSHKNSSGNVNHLLPLYQTLGKELNSMNRDIDVIILAKDVLLARQSGLPNLRTHFTTRHGGLPVSALSTIS